MLGPGYSICAACCCSVLSVAAEIGRDYYQTISNKRPSCLIVSIFTFSSCDYRPIAESLNLQITVLNSVLTVNTVEDKTALRGLLSSK
jgi:hypothetical protein